MSQVRKWNAGTLNAPRKDLIQLGFVGLKFLIHLLKSVKPHFLCAPLFCIVHARGFGGEG